MEHTNSSQHNISWVSRTHVSRVIDWSLTLDDIPQQQTGTNQAECFFLQRSYLRWLKGGYCRACTLQTSGCQSPHLFTPPRGWPFFFRLFSQAVFILTALFMPGVSCHVSATGLYFTLEDQSSPVHDRHWKRKSFLPVLQHWRVPADSPESFVGEDSSCRKSTPNDHFFFRPGLVCTGTGPEDMRWIVTCKLGGGWTDKRLCNGGLWWPRRVQSVWEIHGQRSSSWSVYHGCWLDDTGCWLDDTGCWLDDTGCWLDTGMGSCQTQTLVPPTIVPATMVLPTIVPPTMVPPSSGEARDRPESQKLGPMEQLRSDPGMCSESKVYFLEKKVNGIEVFNKCLIVRNVKKK